MTTLLPRDSDGTAIGALRLIPGGAQTIAVGAASVRTATAFSPDTRVIAVYATQPAFIQSGGTTVTASGTDHYLPADTLVYLSLGGDKRTQHTWLAAIQATAVSGVLYVSELE